VQSIARGISKTGAGVEMMDLKSADVQELVECVGKSGAVCIMAPPTSGPAASAITTLFAAVKPKQPLLLAESYGGTMSRWIHSCAALLTWDHRPHCAPPR